ncbi:uncharacterized protein LOC119331846 [Triticum dicoccoides]|uniref:uncharacterized protein LOC119331846 n=1 Tax=Triticum dicoccoides TaxID=85692 RepID=UPI0018910E28|nr:uncharacterized protein LOC119331846 [Triticum dicoccoides]
MQDVTPGAQMGSSSTGLGGESLPIPQPEVPDPIRESQESMESDDSLHTTLLIETMAYDQEQGEKEKVVEMVGQHDSTLKVTSEYMVGSPEMNAKVIPTPPLVTEENLCFSLRNVQNKLERVEDKAAAAAKKRNMEGRFDG